MHCFFLTLLQCCHAWPWMTPSEPAGPGWRAWTASSDHVFGPLSPRTATGYTTYGARRSTTWNTPQIPCLWHTLGRQAWYFSHNFGPRPIQPTNICAGSSSGLDGSIKMSSIPPIQVWLNLQPAKATARAVPQAAYGLNTFPKRQLVRVLGTDPDMLVQELPRVTQSMAQDALQLEIRPKYHVSGTPWADRHGITVITLVPGRFSPQIFVRVQARA